MKRQSIPKGWCLLAEGLVNFIVKTGDLKDLKFWAIVSCMCRLGVYVEFYQ